MQRMRTPSTSWEPLTSVALPSSARALNPSASPASVHVQDGAKPDDRSMWCASMMSLPAARITPLLYPRLLPVHQMLGRELEGLPDGLVRYVCACVRVCAHWWAV